MSAPINGNDVTLSRHRESRTMRAMSLRPATITSPRRVAVLQSLILIVVLKDKPVLQGSE